ncbi:hypothetical protein [Mitsuaria sp. 7]|uniref:hypothetical protein n=1 Tax=Mitsuaria sp. 7 TaxID=1658665 RepID=UPI0012FA1686|nr:hypothetical protein [Mitsuaria sp. 7]
MRGYIDVVRSTSACVHFVEAHEVSDDLMEIREELLDAGIRCAYIDCRKISGSSMSTCEVVALAIDAENAPYGEEHWIRLLDDMISLSRKLPGLVIILDHAELLLNLDRTIVFDLTEAFLVQMHHWLGKNKPCHLCFQMSPNPLVGEAFAVQ